MIFKRIIFLILLSFIITNTSKSDFKEIKKKAIITKPEIIFPIREKLDKCINNSIETVKTAVSILESIFKNGYRYQKAGVMLTGLRNDDGRKNLFSSEKDEKIKSLMRSIDNTNYRYGRSTLSLASAGVHKKWNMRRQYSSKIDTADFYCLPTIRAI